MTTLCYLEKWTIEIYIPLCTSIKRNFLAIILIAGFTAMTTKSAAQQIIYHQEKAQFEIINLKPLKTSWVDITNPENIPGNHDLVVKSTARSQKFPHWRFFWTFGDGNFHQGGNIPKVRHRYVKEGTYKVSVLATPYYSQAEIDTFHTYIKINTSEVSIQKENEPASLSLQLSDSGLGILTENTFLRYAASYNLVYRSCPSLESIDVSQAYIVLLYNKVEVNVSSFIDRPNKKWEEDFEWSDLKTVFQMLTNEKHFGIIRKLKTWTQDDQITEKVIKINIDNNLDPLQLAQTLFFDVNPNSKLKNDIRKFDLPQKPNSPNGNLEFAEPILNIKFLLITNSCQDHNVMTPGLVKGRPFRDPNNILVHPKKAFVKKESTKLQYQINFQTEGEGIVNQVSMTLPLHQAKALDIKDEKSIIIEEIMPLCYPCNSWEDDGISPCIEVNLTSSTENDAKIDAVEFLLKRVNLSGVPLDTNLNRIETNEALNDKGFVKFSVNSGKQLEEVTSLAVRIRFNEGQIVQTRPAETDWTIARTSVIVGSTFWNKKLFPLAFQPKSLLNWLQLGLLYEEMPVNNGLGWGIMANLNDPRYTKEIQDSISSPSFSPNGVVMTAKTILDLQNLNFHGRLAYRNKLGANQHIQYGLGLGLVIPLSGKFQIDATLTPVDTTFTNQIQSNSSVSFNFSEGNTLTTFNQNYQVNSTLGWQGSLFCELELNKNFALGLRGELVTFPNWINRNSLHNYSMNVYFKWSLKSPTHGKKF